MAIKERIDSQIFEWTAEDEIQLFFALDGLKPIGIHKHFHMACIVERLSKALNREISSDIVWTHLQTMYNLKALDEMESLPFSNEECEFSLPESEFSAEMKRKGDDDRPLSEELKKETRRESTSTPKPNNPVTTVLVKEKEVEKDKEKEKEKEKKDKEREREIERDIKNKLRIDMNDQTPTRSHKRTRASMSVSDSSPASTPPNVSGSTKRRRI